MASILRVSLPSERPAVLVGLLLPSLEELMVSSSGDTKVSGFNGERLELQLHGSGNVTFSGRYRSLAAGAHGSGVSVDAAISRHDRGAGDNLS